MAASSTPASAADLELLQIVRSFFSAGGLIEGDPHRIETGPQTLYLCCLCAKEFPMEIMGRQQVQAGFACEYLQFKLFKIDFKLVSGHIYGLWCSECIKQTSHVTFIK